jgi:hypothetical protein
MLYLQDNVIEKIMQKLPPPTHTSGIKEGYLIVLFCFVFCITLSFMINCLLNHFIFLLTIETEVTCTCLFSMKSFRTSHRS